MTEELKGMGDVLFTLIGDVDDHAQAAIELKGVPRYDSIRLDASQTAVASVIDRTIVVNNVVDEEAVWAAVGEHLNPEQRPKLASALEKLEELALRRVRVPSPGNRPSKPLLKMLCSGLETQALEYQEALDTWKQSGYSDPTQFHQILRISYNFASDAVRLIRLVISVCDLKPLLYWCTIDKHLALDVAMRGLPWQTHSKASLESYTKIVNGARNHAFHDPFSISSGLEVELPDAALRNVRLLLFSKHGSRARSNEVRFEDQELVELLTEFTRAGRRDTPPAFWERNLVAMEAFLDLLESTASSLVEIRAAMPVP